MQNLEQFDRSRKKTWARRRLMPWLRANMTAWLYEYAKAEYIEAHMSKHSRMYSAYQLDLEQELSIGLL